MNTRIIAGEKRGAVLKTPAGTETTRPTLGRVRESLFMILQPELPGARVLDLFAGCGALGLEALSRGAVFACFVEQAPAALEALRANLEKFGWNTRSRVRAMDVAGWLKQASAGEPPYDLIFLDPPYGAGLAQAALAGLAKHADGWLAPEGSIIAQAGRDEALPASAGVFAQYRTAQYGATQIAFYRRQA